MSGPATYYPISKATKDLVDEFADSFEAAPGLKEKALVVATAPIVAGFQYLYWGLNRLDWKAEKKRQEQKKRDYVTKKLASGLTAAQEDRLADLWIKERQIKEQLDKLRAERDREENVRT